MAVQCHFPKEKTPQLCLARRFEDRSEAGSRMDCRGRKDRVGLPQGPQLSLKFVERPLYMTRGCAARTEGFEHNFCLLGSGLVSVSRWQDLLFKYQASRSDSLPLPHIILALTLIIIVSLEPPLCCEVRGC